MRLAYIANIRMPTEKAHGLQIMKTCEALARLGHEIELIVTDRPTPITEDPFAYYGIKTRFLLTRLHVPDTVAFGRFGYWFETFMFSRTCLAYIKNRSYDVLYGRDEIVLSHIGARLSTPIVWETHTGARNRCTRYLGQRAAGIVAITQGLKDVYVSLGISAQKIAVAPDAVDVEDFAHPESKGAARARLGIPEGKRIVMYIGRLDGWKGHETLLKASTHLPEGTLLVVIGGEKHQVAEFSAQYPSVLFLGQRPYKELPDNQVAADVLVLPNTGTDEISVRFTSPLKLFSYMASGVPIVASDLPSIREVVSEREVFFATPDDPEALAKAIRIALDDTEEGKRRAEAARSLVNQYSWSTRARSIADFIENIL